MGSPSHCCARFAHSSGGFAHCCGGSAHCYGDFAHCYAGRTGRLTFWGCYDHVLDEKGRTSLPKQFRKTLATLKGVPWLTGLPQCLAILPPKEFEALRRKLTAASSTIDSIQRLQRLILGMASPCSIDRQGRMLVPPKLRKWAHLDREIVFTGVGGRIELWDRACHEAELEQTRLNYPDYTRDLKEFGL